METTEEEPTLYATKTTRSHHVSSDLPLDPSEGQEDYCVSAGKP